jgi:predicted  nucleic acid-binding Zn-ribbon protein
MHPQLEVLLQIQDLKGQQRELAEGDVARQVEAEEFHMDVEDALRAIDQKLEELEGELDPPIRARYKRMSRSYHRVVVPVIGGNCFGCFVSIPTSVSSDIRSNDEIHHCENCGRFLYVIG